MTSLLTFFHFFIIQSKQIPRCWDLFCNRSQKTLKCGKNILDILLLPNGSCATFLFLPHFDIICNLLLNRCLATWSLLANLLNVNSIFLRNETLHTSNNNNYYYYYTNDYYYIHTVEPPVSGHPRDRGLVSVYGRCPPTGG